MLRDIDKLTDKTLLLESSVIHDGQKLYRLINPSICRDYLYFRMLNITDTIWDNKIVMYTKENSTSTIIQCNEIDMQQLEDLRIFDYRDNVWFTCSRKNKDRLFETLLCNFNNDCTMIDKVHYCIKSDTHIKNLVPLVHEECIFLIDVHREVSYQLSDSDRDNLTERKIDLSLKPNNVNLYGSTQYIQIDDSIYGGIVHDLFYVGRQRYYIHYWVEIDVSRWTLVFISRPFIFRTFGIEFASGLEKTSSGHYQILFGYQDTDSCTCFVSLQQLRFGNNTDKLV